MKVLVGSNNPVKLDAVKEAFEKYYKDVEITGISVESDVPEQPVNSDTFTGAKNRAMKLFDMNKKNDNDFFVGVEGGIIEIDNKWFGFGCMCIVDKNGKIGFGTSPMFPMPQFVIDQLKNGKELGIVIDELSNKENTKHKEGAIGFFTNDVMTRKDLYVNGLITALIPFIKHEYFS